MTKKEEQKIKSEDIQSARIFYEQFSKVSRQKFPFNGFLGVSLKNCNATRIKFNKLNLKCKNRNRKDGKEFMIAFYGKKEKEKYASNRVKGPPSISYPSKM